MRGVCRRRRARLVRRGGERARAPVGRVEFGLRRVGRGRGLVGRCRRRRTDHPRRGTPGLSPRLGGACEVRAHFVREDARVAPGRRGGRLALQDAEQAPLAPRAGWRHRQDGDRERLEVACPLERAKMVEEIGLVAR
jgi:hypothetical protein